MSSTPYMLIFGVTELIFSQIPDFDQIWWLSIVAAVMSFTYSTIGLALGIVQVIGKLALKLAPLSLHALRLIICMSSVLILLCFDI